MKAACEVLRTFQSPKKVFPDVEVQRVLDVKLLNHGERNAILFCAAIAWTAFPNIRYRMSKCVDAESFANGLEGTRRCLSLVSDSLTPPAISEAMQNVESNGQSVELTVLASAEKPPKFRAKAVLGAIVGAWTEWYPTKDEAEVSALACLPQKKANVVPEYNSGHKAALNTWAQVNRHTLPVYSVQTSDRKGTIATVTVAGLEFVGSLQSTKLASEEEASYKALRRLGAKGVRCLKSEFRLLSVAVVRRPLVPILAYADGPANDRRHRVKMKVDTEVMYSACCPSVRDAEDDLILRVLERVSRMDVRFARLLEFAKEDGRVQYVGATPPTEAMDTISVEHIRRFLFEHSTLVAPCLEVHADRMEYHEWFGDSVLYYAVSLLVARSYTGTPHQMTQIRSAAVSNNSLAHLFDQCGIGSLGAYIGRDLASVTWKDKADIIESIVGMFQMRALLDPTDVPSAVFVSCVCAALVKNALARGLEIKNFDAKGVSSLADVSFPAESVEVAAAMLANVHVGSRSSNASSMSGPSLPESD